MSVIVTLLIIIASILLVFIVLMQNPKGGGLSTDFGAAQQIGGVKKTADFVEKATWSLAGFIAVASITMTLMYSTPTVQVEEEQEPTEQVPTDNTGGTNVVD
jgi:preprotein translocase subunit SecG